MTEDWDRFDAADWLAEELAADDEVAFAEVGAVREQYRSAAVRADERRATDPVETTGVWCRVFVEGSTAYRFTTTLTEDNLEGVAQRTRRSARLLGQDTPTQYDPHVVHRDFHPGWDTGTGETGADPLDSLASAYALLDGVEGASVRHQQRSLDLAVLTTTGSAVRTELDRGEVTASVSTDSGRLSTHVGTTAGDVLDRAHEAVEPILAVLDRRADLPTETPPTGDLSVVLGPVAAGQVVYALAQYFEMDERYMGARPFEIGEQIAPASFSLRDVIVPGSWAAMAYDAEGRPTQPTTLVDDGVVTSFLHDTPTALEEEVSPAGNVAFPMGFENPPRIHPRHLDVDPGQTRRDALLDEADVYVERLGPPFLGNEATRTKRRSWMPSSTLYGLNTQEHTPDRYDESAQSVRFRIADGYRLDGGERAATLAGAKLTVTPDDLGSIVAIGRARETVTGTSSKHKSMLPYAVTAPSMRLTASVGVDR
ncbi:MAG: metallopeptidase TldD-related protein [Halolamina sp.]